jgi:hypothetical protein
MTFTALTPLEMQARQQARKMRNLTEAWSVADAAGQLFDALSLSGGEYSTRASHRMLDLCNALLDLIGEDVEAMRDNTAFDLGCDKQGNPIREVEPEVWSDADKMRVFGGYR